jgi:hypothetical protein
LFWDPSAFLGRNDEYSFEEAAEHTESFEPGIGCVVRSLSSGSGLRIRRI